VTAPRAAAGAAAREGGYTIVGLALGGLAVGLVAVLGAGFHADHARYRAQQAARGLVAEYSQAVLHYRARSGAPRCPRRLEELADLGLAQRPPVDPWGQPLVYRCPGESPEGFDVVSTGPDRIEGTADDVNGWE
jgi:hypothetical protein